MKTSMLGTNATKMKLAGYGHAYMASTWHAISTTTLARDYVDRFHYVSSDSLTPDKSYCILLGNAHNSSPLCIVTSSGMSLMSSKFHEPEATKIIHIKYNYCQ